MFLSLAQKKFQNKHKNIDKVYQLDFFRCIISLTYRTPLSLEFVCKLIIQQGGLYVIFYLKVVNWCVVLYKIVSGSYHGDGGVAFDRY